MDRSRQQFLPTGDSATKSLFYSTRMLRNVFISKFSLQLPWTYDTWENILNRPVAKTKHKSNYALRTALCIWAVGGTMHSLGGWHPHGRSQETCPSTQHPQPGVPLKWDKHIFLLEIHKQHLCCSSETAKDDSDAENVKALQVFKSSQKSVLRVWYPTGWSCSCRSARKPRCSASKCLQERGLPVSVLLSPGGERASFMGEIPLPACFEAQSDQEMFVPWLWHVFSCQNLLQENSQPGPFDFFPSNNLKHR